MHESKQIGVYKDTRRKSTESALARGKTKLESRKAARQKEPLMKNT